MGASAVPNPCEPPPPLSSSLPPPPGGGGGRARTGPPFQTVCADAHLPPLAPIEGAPRGAWSSNAAPPGALCMTCTQGPCARRTGSTWGAAAPPSSSPPATPAGNGRGGWGSLLPCACGAAPSGAGASTPASHAGCTSAASCRGKGGKGKGGGGGWGLPHRAACPAPLPLVRASRRGWAGRRQHARYHGKNVTHWARGVKNVSRVQKNLLVV